VERYFIAVGGRGGICPGEKQLANICSCNFFLIGHVVGIFYERRK